jgi:hypothetical protein
MPPNVRVHLGLLLHASASDGRMHMAFLFPLIGCKIHASSTTLSVMGKNKN